MRHHCSQCVTEVHANGRQSPNGELLCYSCYLALWGPNASDNLRSMVARHSGRTNGRRQVLAQRA